MKKLQGTGFLGYKPDHDPFLWRNMISKVTQVGEAIQAFHNTEKLSDSKYIPFWIYPLLACPVLS